MKRSNFLKALLGIAVAPIAIAKAIEQCDTKPEGLMAQINKVNIFKPRKIGHTHIGTSNYISIIRKPYEITDGSLTWYDYQEAEVKQRFVSYLK